MLYVSDVGFGSEASGTGIRGPNNVDAPRFNNRVYVNHWHSLITYLPTRSPRKENKVKESITDPAMDSHKH